MRKVFKKLHLWLALPVGLIITITCLTGALLIFEQEINEIRNPELYSVTPSGEALPLAELSRKVASTLPDSVEITGITVSQSPERSYRFSLSKPHRASIFVNQYTGENLGRQERAEFFTVMFRLHRWLLMPRPEGKDDIFWGKMIVGVSTLFCVILFITGVVIWVPKNKNKWKSRFRIALNKGWARFWHDLHVSGGFYITIVLLAITLTGLTWSFQWYRNGFYAVFGVETKKESSKQPKPDEDKGKKERIERGERNRPDSNTQYIAWDNVLRSLKKSNPEFLEISLSDKGANVKNNSCGNTRGSDSYEFDKSTGDITSVKLYKDLPTSGKIRGWIYAVHVGAWGGMAMRIIYFIMVIVAATLPITGYYIWIKKRMKKEENSK